MISHPSKPIFRLTLSFFAGEIMFSDLKYENIVGLSSPFFSSSPTPTGYLSIKLVLSLAGRDGAVGQARWWVEKEKGVSELLQREQD